MDYKEIVVPKFYRYTSEWVESNITSKYDLSATCRHPDADIQITVYIHHHGQRVVDFAKRLNLKIREVSSPEFSGYDSTAIRKVFGAFSPDCLSPDHWQTELDIVNYELAPKPVLKIISEVRDLHEKALSLYELVKSDLAAIADGMDAKNEELRQLQRDNQVGRLSHSRAIEVLHAGTKEGFVYILSHEWMPRIYKIGFTARNPDSRAKEVSASSGLPVGFKVESYWRTRDPYIVEQRVFAELNEYRKSGGEFFEGSLEHFTSAIRGLLITD